MDEICFTYSTRCCFPVFIDSVLMNCCGLFINQISFAESGPIYKHSATPLLTGAEEGIRESIPSMPTETATLEATNFLYPVEGLLEPVVEFEVSDHN